MKHFHHYLYGIFFLIRTDHGALTWLLSFKQPEGQIARWLQFLGTYNYKIQHRPGLQHGHADALSRRPCKFDPCQYCDKQEVRDRSRDLQNQPDVDQSHINKMIVQQIPSSWIQGKSTLDLREAQLLDPDISLVLKWKEEGNNALLGKKSLP